MTHAGLTHEHPLRAHQARRAQAGDGALHRPWAATDQELQLVCAGAVLLRQPGHYIQVAAAQRRLDLAGRRSGADDTGPRAGRCPVSTGARGCFCHRFLSVRRVHSLLRRADANGTRPGKIFSGDPLPQIVCGRTGFANRRFVLGEEDLLVELGDWNPRRGRDTTRTTGHRMTSALEASPAATAATRETRTSRRCLRISESSHA